MIQDMINPEGQLDMDELQSPLSDQIFDFCESELFPETLQQNNSEVASNSNCCYEEQSSYPTNLSSTPEMNNNKYSSTLENFETKPTNINHNPNDNNNSNNNNVDSSNNDNNFSLIFDSRGEIENDICGAIDFNPSSNNNYTIPPPPQFLNQQEQFDISTLNNPMNLTSEVVMGASSMNHQYNNIHEPPIVPLMATQLPHVYEDECLSSVPSYMRNLPPSIPPCSLLDPTLGSYLPNALSIDNSGILTGAGLFLGPELANHETDYQGDSPGMFCPDNMQRVFNCTNDLQAISNNENQHLIKGRSSSAPLGPEISNLDDSTFKVGKLSVEEKKEKIHRYLKKRNERNFSKKIKYACRKTLADSRPRVRGRFAKNDELVEAARAALMHHEDDTDEECRQMVVVKEEEEMVNTSDIFPHLSGVNSFKCNSIQSWI